MTNIVKTDHPLIRELYGSRFHKGLVNLAPKIDHKRIKYVAFTEFRKNNTLYGCDPLSVCGSILQAVRYQLEPGGLLGQAYLIPYNKICTFQIGYRGMLAVGYRSGPLLDLGAGVVHENDHFDFEDGTHPYIRHRFPHKDRGDPIYFYAVAHLRNDIKKIQVMTVGEVKELRDKYSKEYQYKKENSVWGKNFEEMGKIKPIRRIFKQFPINDQMSEIITLDEAGDRREQDNRGFYQDVTNTRDCDVPDEEEYQTLAQAEVLEQLQTN